MEIPLSLVEAMTDTSSAGIRWLTIKKSNSLEEVPSIAELVGMALTINGEDTTELLALYVAASHRRLGIALQLVERVIAPILCF